MRLHRTALPLLAAAIAMFLTTAATQGHVLLQDPDGGEVLESGSEFTITWRIQIAHNLQNWDLWYSKTGPTGPWIVIAMNLPPGSGSVGSIHTYNWTIPNDPTTQARVRVRMDNSGTDYEDISNGNFTILGCVRDTECDDGDQCTDDFCDPATGCEHVNNSAPCDDEDACTTDDTCSGGACVGGPLLDCDDANACTDDSCDPATGCVYEFQKQVFADICLPYCPDECPQPSLDDILCLLDDFADGQAVDGCTCNGFRQTTDLHPCPEDGGGDSFLGIDDVLVMLDAFAGLSPCGDPCPG